MMYWYLDTRSYDHARLGIFDLEGNALVMRTVRSRKRLTSGTLIRSLYALSSLCGKGKNLVRGVIVEQGPGGFSAVRLGVVTANALSFSLSVQCISIRSDDSVVSSGAIRKAVGALRGKRANIVVPFYGSEPSITVKRSTV